MIKQIVFEWKICSVDDPPVELASGAQREWLNDGDEITIKIKMPDEVTR